VASWRTSRSISDHFVHPTLTSVPASWEQAAHHSHRLAASRDKRSGELGRVRLNLETMDKNGVAHPGLQRITGKPPLQTSLDLPHLLQASQTHTSLRSPASPASTLPRSRPTSSQNLRTSSSPTSQAQIKIHNSELSLHTLTSVTMGSPQRPPSLRSSSAAMAKRPAMSAMSLLPTGHSKVWLDMVKVISHTSRHPPHPLTVP
jgi:hypothetical protein